MSPAQDNEAVARAALQGAVGASFEVRERIGRGGYADVFCAFDPRLKRTVAIKALRRDLNATPEVVERFRREAESVAALRHPNLLPIHDIGEHDGTLYLVLAHIQGESLEHYIRREQQAPIAESVRILREVAAALTAAHNAGIVHRDLKPSNIMLEGAERRALLMDFGLAGALGESATGLTGPGVFIGTPHYLSPEQAAGDTTDQRADIYALGVVAYELIAGRPPFSDAATAGILMQHLTRMPAPLRQVRPDCPAHVAEAIERCLAKSPRERWPSAEAFSESLAASTATITEAPPAIDAADSTPRTSFKLTIALAILVPAMAVALEMALANSLSWSLALVAVSPLVVVLYYGRLWRRGIGFRALMGGAAPPQRDPDEEDFGRHSATIREARRNRARLVRALSSMTRLEQDRLRRCGPAADTLLSRCLQHARQLRSLDHQISAERARTHAPRTQKLLSELLTTREHSADAFAAVTQRLADLCDLVERAQGSDADTSLELQQLLSDHERATPPAV
jgi:tRNA A-37 threonylcarbamoyl transferase component Bud32